MLALLNSGVLVWCLGFRSFLRGEFDVAIWWSFVNCGSLGGFCLGGFPRFVEFWFGFNFYLFRVVLLV